MVIGSGLGGLSCAAYVCAAGKRTLVLESHCLARGCLQVFRRGRRLAAAPCRADRDRPLGAGGKTPPPGNVLIPVHWYRRFLAQLVRKRLLLGRELRVNILKKCSVNIGIAELRLECLSTVAFASRRWAVLRSSSFDRDQYCFRVLRIESRGHPVRPHIEESTSGAPSGGDSKFFQPLEHRGNYLALGRYPLPYPSVQARIPKDFP